VSHPVVWAVTTGAAGMRTQARGLAEAIADGPVFEKIVGVRAPWTLFPGALAPFPLMSLDPAKDRLEPPWPDVLVSCGRKSAIPSIGVRRASRGRTLTVHVQDPLTDPRAFDLVVAMPHDRVSGPNVLKVPTALHDLTPDKLAKAAEVWRVGFTALGRPLIGVIIGGSTRQYAFSLEHGRRLVVLLRSLQKETGAGLAITPSPRTPPEVRALLHTAFAGDPRVFVWDRAGPNPYHGILALADRLVVTSDSLSMVSEAIASGHPVEVFDLGKAAGRHADFLRDTLDSGLARRFEGEATPPVPPQAMDATRQAADAVGALLRERANRPERQTFT
jgi:mitochondrial fission protein ELM1